MEIKYPLSIQTGLLAYQKRGNIYSKIKFLISKYKFHLFTPLLPCFLRVLISACKKTPIAALCSTSKQSFTNSKLLFFSHHMPCSCRFLFKHGNKLGVFFLILIIISL